MSKTNRHRTNHEHSISLIFMSNLFPNRKNCPRRSCKGTLVEVLTRYYDQGPLNYELECTECGKVVKDPRFKREREKAWQKNKWKHNKKKPLKKE